MYRVKSITSLPENEFREKYDESRKIPFDPPDSNLCKIKFELDGPYSALESNLLPIARFSKKAEIAIESTSVNCVVLETEPHEKFHERVYVGANVTENKNRDRIVVRKTVFEFSQIQVIFISNFLTETDNSAGHDLFTKYSRTICHVSDVILSNNGNS